MLNGFLLQSPHYMDLKQYYQTKIDTHSQDLRKINKRRNLVTISKLITFAVIGWIIYLLVLSATTTLVLGIFAMIALFISLTLYDAKVVARQKICEILLNDSRDELKYIEGETSQFITGSEYLDPSHPYSNDLDIFGEESLFQSINRTITIKGRNLLANYLGEPSVSDSEITDRQNAVKEIKNHIEWSHRFRAIGKFYTTSSKDNNVIEDWQTARSPLNRTRVIVAIYFANFINISCWILSVLDIIPFIIPEVISMLQLGATLLCTKLINKEHLKLDKFIKAIGNYFYLIKAINSEEFSSPRLVKIKSNLFENVNALTAFASLRKILGNLDQRNNVFVVIFLDGLYMRSLHHTIIADKWKSKYGGRINEWVDSVSEIDVLISMANFSFNHPEFTTPMIDKSTVIKGKEMCHPLLRSASKVSNDFAISKLHELFIVTGANMAGKSTFLRTVGVNFVLALSGNVVCSSELYFQPMKIFTSMRTTDNLSKGTSYFHAELLRLKELVNMANNGNPMFIILDEMLKGTNSEDKLNGSLRFLQNIINLPICGLVATHDLALGELSDSYSDNFFNVCFEIEHMGDDIVYDYKLKEGVSKNMNASILLEQMGLISKLD